MHTYTPANSIFDGPITNLLSILCILIEVSSPFMSSGGNFNDLKFGTFICSFKSKGTASTAVNGLKAWNTCTTCSWSAVGPPSSAEQGQYRCCHSSVPSATHITLTQDPQLLGTYERTVFMLSQLCAHSYPHNPDPQLMGTYEQGQCPRSHSSVPTATYVTLTPRPTTDGKVRTGTVSMLSQLCPQLPK